MRPVEIECDKLWSRLIKKIWLRRCALCGKVGTDPHHMIKRRFKAFRYAIMNGILLCRFCHMEVEERSDYEYLLAKDSLNKVNKTWLFHYAWVAENANKRHAYRDVDMLTIKEHLKGSLIEVRKRPE